MSDSWYCSRHSHPKERAGGASDDRGTRYGITYLAPRAAPHALTRFRDLTAAGTSIIVVGAVADDSGLYLKAKGILCSFGGSWAGHSPWLCCSIVSTPRPRTTRQPGCYASRPFR